MDKRKLLPGSTTAANKGGSIVLASDSLIPKSKLSTIKTNNFKSSFGGSSSGPEKAKKKIIDINTIIENNLRLTKEQNRDIKRKRIKDKQKEKEKKLEKKSKPKTGKIQKPSLPKTGFLDGVKNYIGNILMGILFTNIDKVLPIIENVSKGIVPVAQFLANTAKTILEGLVNFIDIGYKAYDQIKKWIGEKYGERGIKKFDEFAKTFDTFITGAITLGILYSSGGKPGLGGGRSGGGGRRIGGGDWRTQGAVVKGKGGFKQAYDNMLKKGNLNEGEKRVVRDYKRLVKAGYHPDSAANVAFRRNDGFWKFAKNVRGGGFSVDTAKDYRLAKAGRIVKPKAILGTVRPFLKRIPLPAVGALIDFGLSIAMGEPLGRAAFKAIGSGLLGAIGVGFGGPVGAILGGMAGDWAGGQLYDIFFSGKKQPSGKIQSRSKGGEITTMYGAKRSYTRRVNKKIVRPKRLYKQISQPGKNAGGIKKIEKFFPNPSDKDKMNQFKYLKKASSSFKEIPSFVGNLMGSAIDAVMGQQIEKQTIEQIGDSLGILVQNSINQTVKSNVSEIAKSIHAAANGGVVPRTSLQSKDSKNDLGFLIGRQISRTFTSTVGEKVNQIINNLRRELMLTPSVSGAGGGGGGGRGGGGGGAGGGILPGDAPPEIKALLEAIAAGEGGWDSVNPGTSVTGLSKMTIAQARESALAKGTSLGGTGAMGKWQHLPDYRGSNEVKKRALAAGLDYEKDLFSPENQTKMTRAYLVTLRSGGEAQLVKDLKTDPVATARYLNGVWPSLPGGSQQNQDEKTFKDRYNRSLEKYKTITISGKGVDPSKLPPLPPTDTLKDGSQRYGAARPGGRKHAGVDFDIKGNEKFYSRIGGVVVGKPFRFGDDGWAIDIYNKELGVYERIAEANTILVKPGQKIIPGQAVAQGESRTGVIHYEIRTSLYGGYEASVNPLTYLRKLATVAQRTEEGKNTTQLAALSSQALTPNQLIKENFGLNVGQERSFTTSKGIVIKAYKTNTGFDFFGPGINNKIDFSKGQNKWIIDEFVKTNGGLNPIQSNPEVKVPNLQASAIQEYTDYSPSSGTRTIFVIQPLIQTMA